MGRATQGVRLINLEKRNDQIGSVCKVTSESLEEVDLSDEDEEIINPENVSSVEQANDEE